MQPAANLDEALEMARTILGGEPKVTKMETEGDAAAAAFAMGRNK